jgi:hypothetical protein
MQNVPCTTAIRRSRVGNMDNGRLARRLAHLNEMFARPWHFFAHTTAARHRVAERWVIEQELIRRGLVSESTLRRLAVDARDRVWAG